MKIGGSFRRSSLSTVSFVTGIALAGCATPPFDVQKDGKGLGPTVEKVVRHIDCQLAKATEQPAVPELDQYLYIAQATLTLEVTHAEGANPTLSFLPTGIHAMTAALGGQFSGTQHRTLNVITQIDFSKLAKAKDSFCDPKDGVSGTITGDLGLEEALKDGVIAIRANGAAGIVAPIPSHPVPNLPGQVGGEDKRLNSTFTVEPNPAAANVWIVKTYLNPNLPSSSNPTAFSTQIDFTVAEGVSGGPTWALKYFKGPAASSNLFNFLRTAKDTLVLNLTARCDKTRPGPVKDPKNYFETLAGCQNVEGKLLTDGSLPEFDPDIVNALTPAAVNTLQTTNTNTILQSLTPGTLPQ